LDFEIFSDSFTKGSPIRVFFWMRRIMNSFSIEMVKLNILHNIYIPYEMHLLKFNTEEDFYNFKQDEERKKFFRLKQQSIKSALTIQGKKLK